MKAAILKAFGSPLAVETLPNPVLGTGEVIVDVVATRVLSYAGEVFSGERKYLLDLPAVPGPGGVGRVRAVGPDATHLAIGDWVSCDPTVRSRDDALAPDILLQGLTAAGEGGLRLQKHFRHGSFAEQVLVPTENAKPIGPINAADAARWCALGTLLVPYGGFLAARLQPGETVLVSGATGNFGSAGIAVALAMGAGCVIATGRNEKTLADLARRFGPRVRTVKMLGDEDCHPADNQKRDGGISPDERPLLDRFAATGRGPVKAPAEAAFAQKSVIMTLDQVGFHLTHRVQHDADHDQKTGAAEKLRRDIRHAELL